ncbi:MAG: sulfatase [Bryobacteraceae bacterium]
MLNLTRRQWICGAASLFGAQPRRNNVLLIVVDDLRPELGCYGNSVVKTPHIDALAQKGVLFTRAYCQQAVCTPSRTSFLTGLRPDTTKVYDNGKDEPFRAVLPNVTTLPQHFRRHGYMTRGLGKVFGEAFNDPEAWTTPLWPEGIAGMQYVDLEKWAQVPATEKARTPIPTLEWKKLDSIQAPDVPDNALQDGQVADRAVAALRELRDKPFFLAVGFLKPHLPFVAPKKYFDLYTGAHIPEPANPQAPENAPPVAMHDWKELRGYKDIPRKGPLPPGKTKELIRAYYAATSYTDAQIGKVLAELQRLNLTEQTTVVLMGDHGWHLGEHNLWAKTTNFELDTRAPLIVAGAGVPARSTQCAELVEFVDLFPTLCDMHALPAPAQLEGYSFLPLLRTPAKPWKRAVFSQFPRPFDSPSKRGAGMGRSVRTKRYRYTEWHVPGVEDAVELYDHQNDPRETVNIATDPRNSALIAELRNTLKAGWRAALPEGK